MTQQRFTADYAVLGVGSIAEAIMTGLCRDADAPPRVVLSPRGHARATRLAARFPTVRVAPDNQDAASSAGTVLLCLRPQDAVEALASVRLDAGQRVVSVMASLTSAELAELIGPVAEISRGIPATAVSSRQGFTPVYPAGSAAQRLFDELGGSLVLSSERLLDATSVASATVAAHLTYLETVSAWLARQGVDADESRRLLASVFAGATAGFAHSADFAELARQHATPGGLNERLAAALRRAGVYQTVERGLDELLGRPPAGHPGQAG